MTEVKQTQGILTEQQYNATPYKDMMSYQDYMLKALKFGSAFTLSRAVLLQKSENTSKNIDDSVKGFYLEREARKDKSEQEYYAALKQYSQMKSAKYKSEERLKYTTSTYGEDSLWYSDAAKKYDTSNKSLFSADINLEVARDHFNFDNNAAFKAYLTSRLV